MFWLWWCLKSLCNGSRYWSPPERVLLTHIYLLISLAFIICRDYHQFSCTKWGFTVAFTVAKTFNSPVLHLLFWDTLEIRKYILWTHLVCADFFFSLQIAIAMIAEICFGSNLSNCPEWFYLMASSLTSLQGFFAVVFQPASFVLCFRWHGSMCSSLIMLIITIVFVLWWDT